MNLKIIINLKKDQEVAGSLAANVGNVQILLLHRVIRLAQLYLMPLEIGKVASMIVSGCHWVLGPSIKTLLSNDKFINIKFTMDGPTFHVPEMKENPQLLTFYLGNIIYICNKVDDAY